MIGQEPDALNSDYDPSQSLRGRVLEFNIWNISLNEDIILGLSNCSMIKKGNIVAWEKSRMKFYGTDFQETSYPTLCQKFEKQVLVSKKMSYEVSREYCQIHGGKLHVPESDQANSAMLDLLNLNTEKCSSAMWLNFDFWEDESDQNIVVDKYSNFKKKTAFGKCSMMKSDGSWMSRSFEDCINVHLCFLCSFEEEPIFTLKGLCEKSRYNFVYYLEVTNEGLEYAGSSGGHIKQNGSTWLIQDWQGGGSLISAYHTFDALGRMNWTGTDYSCGMSDKDIVLTLSVCNMDDQYTCRSGQCLDKSKLCNHVIDCTDQSDEDNCDKIIPSANSSPKEIPNPNGNQTLLLTKIRIEQFDEINTFHSTLTLTLDITINWTDPSIILANSPEFSGNPIEIVGKFFFSFKLKSWFNKRVSIFLYQ